MANHITLDGTVFRPEKRYTQVSGIPILTFSLSFYAGKDKDQKARYGSIQVKVFKDLAENAAAVIKEKHRILVSGRLDQDVWEKDGIKNYRLVLIADEITIPFSRFPANGAVQSTGTPETVIRDEDIPF